MTFFCYVVVRCVALVLVVLSGCLLLDFPNVYHAKTSSFCSFSDKNFATDPQIAQSQNTKSMVFATLSPKCYRKTRTKNKGKRKPRNVVLFTKTSQNTGFSCFFTKIPPKHKRRTPRGGRRTCYLVVVVLVVGTRRCDLRWGRWWVVSCCCSEILRYKQYHHTATVHHFKIAIIIDIRFATQAARLFTFIPPGHVTALFRQCLATCCA